MSFHLNPSLSGACLLAIALQTLVPHKLCSANPDSTYRFETKQGKIVGAWPDVWTVERLVQLRTRYGFNSIAVPAERPYYNAALEAGYTPQHILLTFSYGNGPAAVDSFPSMMYYVDEAVEHNCAGQPTAGPIHSPQELAALRDYIHQHRPGAWFISSGYKRCSHLRILGEYVDRIMFSSYVNWEELNITYCQPNLGWGDSTEHPFLPIAYDQSPSWTSMKNLFGPKFTMTWIRGREDEYDILLPHANVLQLNGLWVYHGEEIDTTLLLNFCTAAWRNGWMVRIADAPLSHLSSLTATRIGNGGVRLAWSTPQERDHLGYYVERRSGAQGEFSVLPNSFIPRRGLPGEPQEYAFVDSSAPSSLVQYRLRQIDLDSTVRFSQPVQVSAVTGVESREFGSFELFQNYPNPFNPTTTIAFRLSAPADVSLAVVDLLGREVMRMIERERREEGRHTVLFSAEGLASGVYYYRLSVSPLTDRDAVTTRRDGQREEVSQTKKLLLIR